MLINHKFYESFKKAFILHSHSQKKVFYNLQLSFKMYKLNYLFQYFSSTLMKLLISALFLVI